MWAARSGLAAALVRAYLIVLPTSNCALSGLGAGAAVEATAAEATAAVAVMRTASGQSESCRHDGNGQHDRPGCSFE